MRKRHVAAIAALITSAVSASPVVAHAATVPTTYYVDSADTACSDSGPGTQIEPFCGLQTGIDAATVPGDTVEVAGAFYNSVTISNTGTKAAPITIEGDAGEFVVGPSSSGSASAAIIVKGASYVTVKDFGTTAVSAAIASVSASNHVTIDSFNGGLAQAAAISNVPGVEIDGSSSDVTVSRGRFEDEYRAAPSIEVDPGSSDIDITTNGIQAGWTARISSSILVNGASGTEVTSNTVTGGCGTDVVLADGSSGSWVENNVLEAADGCGIPAGSAAVVNADAASTQSTTVAYNVIDSNVGGTLGPNDYSYEWAGKFYTTVSAFTAATGQGSHDLIADPKVGNAPFPFSLISSTSPAINSANSDAPGELPTDVNGNPRLNDPLAPDSGVGAYDYYDRGAAQVQPSTSSAVLSSAVGETGVAVTSQDWSRSEYEIDFGDGTAPVTAAYGSAEHTYGKPGTYEITVSGTSWADGTPFADTTTFRTHADAAGEPWQAQESNGVWSAWEPPGQPSQGTWGFAQTDITALRDGSAQAVAVTTSGVLDYTRESATSVWADWGVISQPGVTVKDAGIAGMPDGSSQFVEVTSAGVLKHDIRLANGSWQASGWGTPVGSTGIAQASITAMPNGDSQLVAVTTTGVLEYNIRYASPASWQGWRTISQPGVTVTDAGIAGMPDGSSQFVEVTSAGVLKHDIRLANGSWQASGWGTPVGSTGIAQASITAMPNGDSQLVAVTTTGVLEHDVRYGYRPSWQGWVAPPQTDLVAGVASPSIAGLSTGVAQVIELSAN